MFNLEGEVIGINTAIFSRSGGSVGIGFAIPASTAEPVINQLIKNGQVRRGWLGVHIQTVTDDIAENLGLDEVKGALVASVLKGGPAEQAGIKARDVILAFAGKAVRHMRQLPRIVAATEIDQPVEVLLWRDNKEISVRVTVGELDDSKTEMASRSAEGEGEASVDSLGLTLSAVNQRMRERFELSDEVKGVVVTEVEDGTAAAEKGVRPGDVIVEVSQEEVTTPAEVAAKVRKARESGRKSVLFLIGGRGGLRFVALRIGQG